MPENTYNSSTWMRMPSRENAESFLSTIKAKRLEAENNTWQQQQNERINDVVNLQTHGAAATDPEIKQCYDKACRAEEVAWMFSAFDWSTWNYMDVTNGFLLKHDPGDKSMYNVTFDYIQKWSWTIDDVKAATIWKVEDPSYTYNPIWTLEPSEPYTYDPFGWQDYSQYDVPSVWKKMPTAWKWWLKLWLLEWAWALWEKFWKSLQTTSVNRSPLDRTQNVSYNSKKWEMSQWENEVERLKSELDEWIKNWESQEWINKKKAQLYDAQKEIERLSKTEKPIDSREILAKYGITWNEEEIAGKAKWQSKFLWKSKVDPLIKWVEETVDIEKFFSELSPEDFTKEWRLQKQYKEILDDYLYSYIGKNKVTLEEVREIYNGLPDLSKEAVEWDIPKQVEKRIADKFKTFLQDSTKEALKKQYPDQVEYIDELFNDISKLKAQEESATKWSSLKAKPFKLSNLFSKKWWVKLLDKTKYRTQIGKWIENVSSAIRPTTWLKWLIKWWDKINKLLGKISQNIWNKWTEWEAMGWDLMDILIAQVIEEAWLEPGIYPIGEIAAYAYEMNKLNKENWTDLPLYDKENSYVNQNPNSKEWPLNSITERNKRVFSDIIDDSDIENQEWYKALKEAEDKVAERYSDRISEVDILELLDSLE